MRVVVIGAGVVGLLAAHALAHRGRDVEVVTRDDPARTTSATAGASFKPRLVDDSPLLRPLLVASRGVLEDWTRSGFARSIHVRRHRHVVATRGDHLDLAHLDVMDDVRWSHGGGGPAPAGARVAVGFDTWFFDVERVLPAMLGHLTGDHDVVVTRHRVDRLDDVAGEADALVNATGLGARHLVGDPAMVAVRGRVVRVRSPHLAHWDPDRSVSMDGSYVYPRADGLLVGGTAEVDVDDTTPDPSETARLVAAATVLAPGLAATDPEDAEPLAGLRPYRRGGVRVARGRDVAGTPVVHAYGHGGAGWTLAPGTAERVADLLADAAT